MFSTMKMTQNIKEAYAKMSSDQLEKELKKSIWAIAAVLGILFLGMGLKIVFLPHATWTSYLDNLIWLWMVGLFVFNFRVIRNELASREEAIV